MHQIYPHTVCACVDVRFWVYECICVMKCVSHVCLYVYTTNTSVTTDQMLKACSVLFSVTPKKSIMNIIFRWNNMESNQFFFCCRSCCCCFGALWADYFGRAFETKLKKGTNQWSWLNVTLNWAYRKRQRKNLMLVNNHQKSKWYDTTRRRSTVCAIRWFVYTIQWKKTQHVYTTWNVVN